MKRRRGIKGASGMEYGVVVGLVSVMGIAAVFDAGESIKDLFTESEVALAGMASGSPGSGGGPVNLAPTVATVSNLAANETIGFSHTFSGFADPEGGTVTYQELGTWPDWLGLTDAGGGDVTVSGTPTSQGTWSNLAIRATDEQGATTDTDEFEIVVDPVPVGPYTAACGDGRDSCIIIDWWNPSYAVIENGYIDRACFKKETFNSFNTWSQWTSWANSNWRAGFRSIGLPDGMMATGWSQCVIGDYDDWYAGSHRPSLATVFSDPSYTRSRGTYYNLSDAAASNYEIYWYDLD